MEEEEETKQVNGKKTIFSVVSLDTLPFSIIWCVLGVFYFFNFFSVVECFDCIVECFGVFEVY